MIEFLQGDATLAGKQYICHVLSIYGTSKSVPVLIEMVESPETYEMALYALERIPAKEISEKLQDLLDDAEGKTKVGIINTLGNRQDKEALAELIPLINDKNPEISSAAIHSIGLIGGDDAAKALSSAHARDKANLQIADAYLLVATGFMESGMTDKANKIYSALNNPFEAKQIQYAALRGMILTTKEDVSVLILDGIRSENKSKQTNAIQLVRVIPPEKDVTAIARLLPELSADGQVQLLSALAGRTEPSVVKAMMTQVKSDNEAVQIAALKSLSMSKNAESVALFAEVAGFKQRDH